MKKVSTLTVSGVNIQAPWSELIVSGKKKVETRSYPLPKKFENQPLAVIETPGPKKLVPKARIIGVVVFSSSILYSNEQHWKSDHKRHLVDTNDPQFKFNPSKPKYGWVISFSHRFSQPLPPPKLRGIVFATNCKIPSYTQHN